MDDSAQVCPECGSEQPAGAVICTECLQALGGLEGKAKLAACPDCGKANALDAERCWRCGYKLGFDPEERVAGVTPGLVSMHTKSQRLSVASKVFMIAAGRYQHAEYLRLLSGLASLVKNEAVRQELIDTTTPTDFFDTLCRGH